MDLIKLGEILKEKRDELGISLRDAGELIGISHNYLSILEKAMDPRSAAPIKPTIDTLKLICDAYNLDINKLLSLSGYTDIVINTNIKSEDIDSLDIYLDELKKEAIKRNINFDTTSPSDLLDFLEFIQKTKAKKQ